MKWCHAEVTNNQDQQALQRKTDRNLKDNGRKCSSTLGESNSHKEQGSWQESSDTNISDTVNKTSLKRTRRQPINRNNDFLWTNVTKN